MVGSKSQLGKSCILGSARIYLHFTHRISLYFGEQNAWRGCPELSLLWLQNGTLYTTKFDIVFVYFRYCFVNRILICKKSADSSHFTASCLYSILKSAKKFKVSHLFQLLSIKVWLLTISKPSDSKHFKVSRLFSITKSADCLHFQGHLILYNFNVLMPIALLWTLLLSPVFLVING